MPGAEDSCAPMDAVKPIHTARVAAKALAAGTCRFFITSAFPDNATFPEFPSYVKYHFLPYHFLGQSLRVAVLSN